MESKTIYLSKEGIDTICLTFCKDSKIELNLTDGDYDRDYRLDIENSIKLKQALGIENENHEEIEKTIFSTFEREKEHDYYTSKFKEICEANNIV